MPFPVDEQYINETEANLKVKFPPKYRCKMMEENGGEIETEDFYFQLHPFFDKSNKKRISRTCNHIGLETNNAQAWTDFPENAIVIGSGGSGDLIFLEHNGDGTLSENVYLWDHGEIEEIAESILELVD